MAFPERPSLPASPRFARQGPGEAGWQGVASARRRRDLRAMLGLLLLALVFAGGGARLRAGTSVTLEADPADLITRVWQVEDGLPQNSVICFAQTPDGYLWLGTFNGLVRFDGVRFTVFEAADTPGLASSRIVRLFCDRQGQLWLVDEAGGVTLRRAGGFVRVGAGEPLANDHVHALGADAAGRVHVGTRSGAIYRWENDRFVPALARVAAGPPWPPIFQLEAHPEAGLLAVCDGPLALHVRDGQAVPLQDPEGRTNEIRRVAPCRSGGFWAVTTHNGILRWQGGAWSRGRWTLPPLDRHVWQLLEDHDGDLWLAQYQEELWRLPARGPVTPVKLGQQAVFARPRALFEDREQNLWAGSDGEGLAKLRPRLLHMLDRKAGLRQDAVTAVMESRAGELWLGYSAGGVDQLSPSGETRVLQQPPFLATNTPVWGLLRDRSDGVWVSTYNAGVVRYADGRFTEVAGLPTRRVLALFEDREGGVWVGGRNDRGELAAGLAGSVARCFGGGVRTYPWSGPEHDGVRAITQDAGGTVWLGTDGAGLLRVVDGEVVPFVAAEGVAPRRVAALAADAEGHLWVGTFRDGLVLVRDGRCRHFRSGAGLTARSVLSLTWADADQLWMTTELGLIRVSRRELLEFADGQDDHLAQIRIDRESGLPGLGEIGQPCFTRDGRAWVPTSKGVGVFPVAAVPSNTNPPPVQIEAVTVNGVRQSLARAGTGPLRIPAGNRTLEFHFTALSFSDPTAVRFRYRLDGLDAGWVWAGGRHTAFYTLVPPGDYEFRVLAANNHGVWNTTGATVSLRVEPFFWQTGWFRWLTLGGLAVLSAGGAALVMALRQRRALQLAEERNVRLRAEALAAANGQLELKARELADALTKVRTLRGLIPICASCKRIRDDRGFWNRVELYLQEHSEATFSHSLCPECVQKFYPDVDPASADPSRPDAK